MRKKTGFALRDVCGEQVIIAEGKENIDFSKIISMNASSAYLWNNISESEFTEEELCSLLMKEYDVDENTALADVKNLTKQWLEAGIIE